MSDSTKPKFGVHLPVMGFEKTPLTAEQLIVFSQKAEELRFDSLSVNDHIVFGTSWLDSISTLSAIAAKTNYIQIGTSILNIVVRNPVICSKAIAAIDIISNGRFFAGVGPGSSKGDYEACGIPFEERWGRFDEALQIIRELLQEHSSRNFSGKYYNYQDINLEPKSIQKPHPPIFIGSWGSDVGLKRVAKYSEGWMASAYNITHENFKEKWKQLLEIRKSLGKETEGFENSIMTMFGFIDEDKEKTEKMLCDVLAPGLGRDPEKLRDMLLFGSVDQCRKKIGSLVSAGVQRIHFWPVGEYTKQIEIFSKEISSFF